jgi:CheY-like chemotaxis protein
LELALLNLAVNARDAMPGGGKIVIDATEIDVASGERPDLGEGSYVRLSVIDNGEGMDAATIERAREPFFTTKGVGKGTGLGLSMVHGFAQQCGGSLTISSEQGHGTTVSLWLPVAQGDDEWAAPTQPIEEMIGENAPLVILAVDDDDLVLMNTAGMLEELGHTVFQASSAREALHMLERGTVDLVVTDHAMPGMTGAQLADSIEQLRPGLPVIIITGFAELPPHVSGRLRLDKPFRQTDLARAIGSIHHSISRRPAEDTANIALSDR